MNADYFKSMLLVPDITAYVEKKKKKNVSLQTAVACKKTVSCVSYILITPEWDRNKVHILHWYLLTVYSSADQTRHRKTGLSPIQG